VGIALGSAGWRLRYLVETTRALGSFRACEIAQSIIFSLCIAVRGMIESYLPSSNQSLSNPIPKLAGSAWQGEAYLFLQFGSWDRIGTTFWRVRSGALEGGADCSCEDLLEAVEGAQVGAAMGGWRWLTGGLASDSMQGLRLAEDQLQGFISSASSSR
jgi:hypothetical protein